MNKFGLITLVYMLCGAIIIPLVSFLIVNSQLLSVELPSLISFIYFYSVASVLGIVSGLYIRWIERPPESRALFREPKSKKKLGVLEKNMKGIFKMGDGQEASLNGNGKNVGEVRDQILRVVSDLNLARSAHAENGVDIDRFNEIMIGNILVNLKERMSKEEARAFVQERLDSLWDR